MLCSEEFMANAVFVFLLQNNPFSVLNLASTVYGSGSTLYTFRDNKC